MKSIRSVLTATLLAAGAVLTAATGLSIASAAEEATTAPPPPPGPHAWNHRGPWHLLGKLDLSAEQKQQIKTIMESAHPQMQSVREQMRANSLKLQQTKPTDPNYASIASAVSQTHGSLSAQIMNQRADVRAQVFKVLTPAQQTQLATLEAEMQAKRQAHQHGPQQ
jgi:periplasmic protein CpxP/Spy